MDEKMKPTGTSAKKIEMFSQANALTDARYKLSPIEKNALAIIFAEVKRVYGDKDLADDEGVQLELEPLGFEELSVTLDCERLKKAGARLPEVRKAIRSLTTRLVEIDLPEENWVMMPWLTFVKSNAKEHTVTVCVNKHLVPLICHVLKRFTSYNLTVLLALRTFASKRLYELCCKWRQHESFFLTVDEFRKILQIQNYPTYENFGAIRQQILEVAKKELKELYDKGLSDLYFNYKEGKKHGKKVETIGFYLHVKEKADKLNYDDLFADARALLKTFIKRDKKYIEATMDKFKMYPDKAVMAVGRMHKIAENPKYPANKVGAVFRVMLEVDWDDF